MIAQRDATVIARDALNDGDCGGGGGGGSEDYDDNDVDDGSIRPQQRAVETKRKTTRDSPFKRSTKVQRTPPGSMCEIDAICPERYFARDDDVSESQGRAPAPDISMTSI